MKKTPYQEVVVSVRDASGRDVDAITCQGSAWAALRRDGVPSARYLGIIEEGARELGLVDYADALSKRPRANPSRFLRAVAGAHGVVSLMITKPYFPWVERDRLVKTTLDAVFDGLLKP